MISLIAAMTKNMVIGNKNKIPWNLPEDMAWFKKHTSGKTVIMGRKTFESIGGPLKNRKNIVITSDIDYSSSLSSNVLVYNSISEAVAKHASEDIFIIGGQKIYEQTLSIADKLYITIIDTNDINGDAFFPEIDMGQWHQEYIERKNANGLEYKFLILNRI